MFTVFQNQISKYASILCVLLTLLIYFNTLFHHKMTIYFLVFRLEHYSTDNYLNSKMRIGKLKLTQMTFSNRNYFKTSAITQYLKIANF